MYATGHIVGIVIIALVALVSTAALIFKWLRDEWARNHELMELCDFCIQFAPQKPKNPYSMGDRRRLIYARQIIGPQMCDPAWQANEIRKNVEVRGFSDRLPEVLSWWGLEDAHCAQRRVVDVRTTQ